MKFKRILLLNPFGIGDVLFSTPVLSFLKKRFPNSFIAYICNKRVHDALIHNPNIDKVIIFEKDDWRALWKKQKILCIKEFIKFIKELRDGNFDLAIDISLTRHWSLLFKLMGIRERIGFNYNNRGLFLTRKLNIDGFHKKHVVDYNMDLMRLLFTDIESNFKLEFYLDDKDEKWVEEILSLNNVNNIDLLIGIIPGGGSSWGKDAHYKHWPVEYFAKVNDGLVKRFNAKTIIFGSSEEAELCDEFLKLTKYKPISVCAKTTLGQFAGLIKRCKIVVCNDGGPLHIAVSLGVKTVSIFGPVDPLVYGPYPIDAHKVIFADLSCRPCYRRFKLPRCIEKYCLKKISPEVVSEAVGDILNGR